MKNILTTIWNNKEWLFSGLGIYLITYLFKKNNYKTKQNQKSGKNCKNIQVGGDYKNGQK